MGASQKKKMERQAIHFRRSETMLWARIAMAIHRKASILKNQSNGQY